MLTVEEKAFLEAARTEVRYVADRIAALKHAGQEALFYRQDIADRYQALRRQVVKRELRDRGLVQCTNDREYPPCGALVKQSEAVFVFIECALLRTHGSNENRSEELEAEAVLYQLCPTCAQKMFDQHGWTSGYQESWKTSTFFHAFSVERQSHGFYMRKFGRVDRLTDDQVKTLGDLSESFIDKYIKDWALLPKMEYRQDGSITLNDTVATAAA